MIHPLADLVRRADPDRFFCALFAPAPAIPALLTLIAFNHELARAREAASEPGLALIRLQWWRDVVEGAQRRHEVAEPLSALLAAGTLHPPDLLAMLDTREQELDPPGTAAGLIPLFLQGPGSMAVAAGRLLGADTATLARLRRLGAGYGLAGAIRNAVAGAPALLPDALADREAGIAAMRAEGLALLGAPERMPAAAIAAALPAVLARRDLRRTVSKSAPRGLGDRAAVTLAALRRKA